VWDWYVLWSCKDTEATRGKEEEEEEERTI
jgi:hypothetical protein